jgi:WD40 repeat protein
MAPRRVNPAIPRDLETIVLKAMAKERDDRYKTAQELAEDLRRFLDRRSIQGRRPSPLDRASRWARRHRRTVVTAVALLVTAVGGLTVGIILIAQAQGRAVRAGALAEARARESRHESLIQQISRLRLATHSSGWSADAWGLVREAARFKPSEPNSFQAQVAGTLIGIDARLIKQSVAPASSLVFDPQGRRLWMGGLGEKLRSWDRTTDQIEVQQSAMDGPFAFRADGTPLQLGMTTDAKTGVTSLQLWDAAKQTAKVFELPDVKVKLKAFALSPEGTYVGAVMDPPAGPRSLIIWEAATHRVVCRISYQAVGMAFSPDARLVVAWDDAGHLQRWTLPDAAPLATLRSENTPIRTVAFGRLPGRAVPSFAAGSWLLAVGDAGGTVTIWDLEKRIPMNYCRGSQYDVFAVAFSPDGTTLASAGRNQAKLWDVVTGRFLLDLKLRNTMNSLAFSPDGSRLAVGSQAAFGFAGGVDVYELEQGRGIRTFRGLMGQVQKTIFSPDGQLVAGLSQDWQVAIWDAASGQLRLILDVPQGLVADNSGLAFSPDGRRFAFSAGRQAKLWDADTGKELGAWKLPDGLQDTLAFRKDNQLLLLRMESIDGEPLADSLTSRVDHPRVMRLRNLLGDRPTHPVRVITDFNWHVHHTAATPDGKYFVVEGLHGPRGGTRSVNAYDALTGEKLWTLPSQTSLGAAAWFHFDPTGKVLSLGDGGRNFLFDMPSRALLRDFGEGALCLGPEAKRWLGVSRANTTDRSLICSVYDQGRERPSLQIAIKSDTISVVSQFSPDGRKIAWGNADGTVSVCDLVEVQRRLAEVDLGW